MDRKPFNIQDYKSNEETPVETRDGRAVKIKSILDEDYTYELYPVKGCIEGELYSTNDCDSWSPVGKYNNSKNINDWDLFFSNKVLETKQQYKLIPFNLLKAKTKDNPNGLDVITQSGDEVIIYDTDYNTLCGKSILAKIKGVEFDRNIVYSRSGRSFNEYRDTSLDLLLKEPIEPRRMTYKELSWWLQEHPEEHRETKFKQGNWIATYFTYTVENADKEVSNCILIRANGGEWKEPLYNEFIK